jgi:X-X-X-Leu-X-X-Gly heptad repeat protein
VSDGKGGMEMGGLVVGAAVGSQVFFGVGLGARRLADGARRLVDGARRLVDGARGRPGDVDSVVRVRPVDGPAPGGFVTVPVWITDGPPGLQPGWVITTSTAMTAAAPTRPKLGSRR